MLVEVMRADTSFHTGEREAVRAALRDKFALADASGWPTAYQEAAKGLVNALEKIGHMTPAETHPVCQEILARIASGSLKGAKLRQDFEGLRQACWQ